MTKEVDVLLALKEDGYRLGDLAAIRYDKSRTDLFPDDYLGHLYNRCRESKRRSGDGILTATFGGNPASDFNSIVTYLATRAFLLILGRWEGDKFHELGFAFPTVTLGTNSTEKAMISGYGFYREAWGTEDQKIVTMLGLAYIFKEFDLRAIIGNRYTDNTLTAKFMGRFGFKDCGEIPCFQLRGTKLVPLVVSALMREDFEQYVADFLVEQYRAANAEIPALVAVEPVVEQLPVEYPAIGDSREVIDEQVARLAAGEIAAVFFPYSSTYVPGIPAGMDLKVVPQGQLGEGIYFFNPRKVEEEQVELVKIIPQPRLVPPAPVIDVQWPEVDEVIPEAERTAPVAAEDWVVVQAFDADGVQLDDKPVERTAEAVAVQFEVFERRFPGCRCEVVAATEDDLQPELPF
jgi:hypothetical protein